MPQIPIMKYFDTLTPAVEDELIKRAVKIEKLLYCVKADVDGEGLYQDTYITFDSENLYILTGIESISGYKTHKQRKAKAAGMVTKFEFKSFDEYKFTDLDELYIDRYRDTARLMVKPLPLAAKTEEEKIKDPAEIDREICLARFSVGYGEKFEKFATRVNKTIKNEEIDDSSLEYELPVCKTCGKRFPDPNRQFCPNCVKRSSTLLRLIKMLGEFKPQVAIVLFMSVISVALSVIAPYFSTKLLYDEVLNVNGSMYGEILYVVLMIAGFQLFSMIFNVIQGLVQQTIAPMVAHKLRTKVFASMQNLSLSFFTSKQTSSLMSRVDRDSMDIYGFLIDILPYSVICATKLIGLLILLFTISVPIASLMVLSQLIIFGMEIVIMKDWRRFSRRRNLSKRGVDQVLTDALNGHRVVKSFAREEQEKERFGGKNHTLYQAEYDRDMRISKVEPFQRGLFRVANSLIYGLGAYLVITGNLAFGGLTLIISYFGIMWEPMFFFIWTSHDWGRTVDAASRMFEILDSVPKVRPPENPIYPENNVLKGNIKLNDVNFEYEAGRPILRHVNFEVKGGQFFGIVGKTGAGKSTIINLISRMYDVTNGEITIDGIPIKQLDFKTLRGNIGVVSQETYLFMGTIADNIRYARPEATMEEVIEAAKSANAHDFILKLPDAYDTKIGSGAHTLSGGEKQRISIARALIQKPNILIMDEATAAMDTKTERKIQAAIDKLKEGRTIIAIAHRLSTLRDADVLCVIENGEVKEMGTHDELIRTGGKYLELYKLQAEALKTIGIGED